MVLAPNIGYCPHSRVSSAVSLYTWLAEYSLPTFQETVSIHLKYIQAITPVVGQLYKDTDMDQASPMDTLLDMFHSLGESLDTLKGDMRIDKSPASLRDEATFQYHVEIGAILLVAVIICLLVSICMVIKKKREKKVGFSRKSSFRYVDFRRPVGGIVRIV